MGPGRPAWGPPPPRRSSITGVHIALIAVLVVLLGVGGVVVAGLMNSGTEVTGDSPTQSTTTTSLPTTQQPTTPSPVPSTTTTTTTPPTTTTTTPPPTTTTTRPPTTTTRPPKPYQNDNYRVPNINRNPGPAPRPETWPQADNYMQRNSLYRRTLGNPVRCHQSNINASTSTAAQRTKYLNDMTACLMRVWGPALQQAGYSMHRPSVTMYSGPFQTKCGRMDDTRNAFFCGGDQQIYWGSNLAAIFSSSRTSRLIFDYVLAHEFGHAVQFRTGILWSANAYRQRYGVQSPQAQTYSRRIELQADCFAGSFMNSMAVARGYTAAERQLNRRLAGDIGGRPGGSHGLSSSRATWASKGLDTSRVAVCNTFTVPASQVQ